MTLYKSKSLSSEPSQQTHFDTIGVSITTDDDLKRIVAQYPHSPFLFQDGRRVKENFISCDVLVMDVDSGCLLTDFRTIFKDIKYLIATSRNHQKVKKEEPACDRFHVYFPLSTPITDASIYDKLVRKVMSEYSFFDPSPKDVARYYAASGVDCITEINDGPKLIDIVVSSWRESVGLQSSKPKNTLNPVISSGNNELSPEDRDELLKSLVKAKDSGLFKDYETWLKLGTGLKSAGFSYTDWQTLSDNTEDPECLLKWEGLDTNTVSLGSLIYFAKQGDPKCKVKVSDYPNITLKDPYTWNESQIEEMIRWFDTNFYINLLGGRVCVVTRDEPDSLYGEALILDEWNKLHQHKKIKLTGVRKLESASKHWVSITKHRYSGEVFFPGNHEKVIDNKINIWKGWGVKQVSGDCTLFLDYIKRVLCNSKEEYYQWLLGYLAHIVQFPTEKETHIVALIGKQGSGKSSLFSLLGRIFNESLLIVDDAERVLGRFNASMKNKIIINLDEATFRGDRKTSNKIKNLVTSDSLNIEHKGRDVQVFRNYIRLWITSNDEDSCLIEPDDRRYFVLKVNSGKYSKDDWTIFYKAIKDDNQVGAFLNFLLTYSGPAYIKSVSPPVTQEKQDSQLDNLNSVGQFIVSLLVNEGMGFGENEYNYFRFDHEFPKHSFYLAYQSYNKKGYQLNQPRFSREVKKITSWRERKTNGIRHWVISSLSETKKHFENELHVKLEED